MNTLRDTIQSCVREPRRYAGMAAGIILAASVGVQPPWRAPRASSPDRTLYALSAALNVEAGARYDRILSALENYLDSVEKGLLRSHPGVFRHTAWGAYGSGFLAHNRVSNDLDVFVNVDLGTVESWDPDRRDAAEQIWERVEIYRTYAARLASWEQRPEFALLHFMDGLSGVTPSGYGSGVEDLASSLRFAIDRVPYLVAIDFRGVTQISTLEPGTGYIPLVTSTTFLSNALEQTPGVFTGIRGISVQFYFTVNLVLSDQHPPLVVQRIPLSPLAPPRQVAKLWQQAYSGVQVGKRSRDFVASVMPLDDDLTSTRLSYALGFYGSMAFELDVRRYPVKFFKRFHSWLDVFGQSLGAAETDAYFAKLDTELSGDAAVFADQLMTLGAVLKDLASNPDTLAVFTNSGDVERTIGFFREASAYLRLRYPELTAELDAVEPELQDLPMDPLWLRDAALTTSKAGLEVMRKISADEPSMRAMFRRASQESYQLGYRPVRMYVDGSGRVLVHSEDLACGNDPFGLLKELTNSTAILRGAEFSILEAEDSRLTLEGALPVPYTQFVLCADSQVERTALSRTKTLFLSSRSDALVRL